LLSSLASSASLPNIDFILPAWFARKRILRFDRMRRLEDGSAVASGMALPGDIRIKRIRMGGEA
jgi:hypothetical protein